MKALLVALLLAAALGRPAAGAGLPPGNYDRMIEFGGAMRHYLLHVPTGNDGATAVPLVIDIHGLGSNSSQQRGISGLLPVSDANGFVIAHPDGLNNAWNAGLCCGNAGIDDVGFMRAVVAAIAAETPVDPLRIYATGLSNGGAMSQRLACDAADLFAATAPLAFPVPFRPLSECHPIRSVPVLTFMGLTDVLVHYEGGVFPSAAETFAHWRDVDGCADAVPTRTVEVGKSYCDAYTQCQNGVEAGFCSITARSFGGAFFDGHILYFNDDLNLASLIWRFLSRFTLPSVEAPRQATVRGRQRLPAGDGPPVVDQVEWTLTLGQGTWWATDTAGNVYTGSGRAKRRAQLLTLTEESRGLLLAALNARASDATGATTALSFADPPTFRVRAGKKGVRLRLRVLLNGAGPRPHAYRLKLVGAPAPG